MRFYSLIALAMLAGCSSVPSEKSCELESSQHETLKSRTLDFLDSEWQVGGSECEEISDITQYVRDFGCGIYVMPAGSSRPGCPDELDGDYFVIYDPVSLVPTKIVLITH